MDIHGHIIDTGVDGHLLVLLQGVDEPAGGKSAAGHGALSTGPRQCFLEAVTSAYEAIVARDTQGAPVRDHWRNHWCCGWISGVPSGIHSDHSTRAPHAHAVGTRHERGVLVRTHGGTGWAAVVFFVSHTHGPQRGPAEAEQLSWPSPNNPPPVTAITRTAWPAAPAKVLVTFLSGLQARRRPLSTS